MLDGPFGRRYLRKSMKYALVVPKIGCDIDKNVLTILNYLEEAKANEAEFVVFPEACISGLVNNDISAHDILYARNIESECIEEIRRKAKENKVYVALGILEREGDSIFDSAICLGPDGTLHARYRRISSGWHGKTADKEIYKEGKEVALFKIGTTTYAYLLCGDLFEDEIIGKIRFRNPDIVIIPFARSSDVVPYTQRIWDKEEKEAYREQAKKLTATVFLTNYMSGPEEGNRYFGGAYVLNRYGEIEAQKNVMEEGILYWEN